MWESWGEGREQEGERQVVGGVQGAGVGILVCFCNSDLTSGVEFYGLLHSVNIEPESLEIFYNFRRIMGCLILHMLCRQRWH